MKKLSFLMPYIVGTIIIGSFFLAIKYSISFKLISLVIAVISVLASTVSMIMLYRRLEDPTARKDHHNLQQNETKDTSAVLKHQEQEIKLKPQTANNCFFPLPYKLKLASNITCTALVGIPCFVVMWWLFSGFLFFNVTQDMMLIWGGLFITLVNFFISLYVLIYKIVLFPDRLIHVDHFGRKKTIFYQDIDQLEAVNISAESMPNVLYLRIIHCIEAGKYKVLLINLSQFAIKEHTVFLKIIEELAPNATLNILAESIARKNSY
jgi:hypothetical protein